MGDCLSKNKKQKAQNLNSLNSNHRSATLNGQTSLSEYPFGLENENKLNSKEKEKIVSEFRPKKDQGGLFDVLYAKDAKTPKGSSTNKLNVNIFVIGVCKDFNFQYFDPTEDNSIRQDFDTPKKKQKPILSVQDKENIFFIEKNNTFPDQKMKENNKENINNFNFMKKISVASLDKQTKKPLRTTEYSTQTSHNNLNKRQSILKESIKKNKPMSKKFSEVKNKKNL